MVKGDMAFYDTNILIAYLFREEGRFDVAEQVLRKHVSKAMSIISIHEIHMYSVKFDVLRSYLLAKTYALKPHIFEETTSYRR